MSVSSPAGGGPAFVVEGATEHNLRDIDVAFGRGVTAIVGVSGSGKSSLVFDVVYHEARRRLLDALQLGSPFTGAPAGVRRIRGLGPAVALGQDTLIRNPQSTVATASGIHPFLRLLYARFAARTCPRCDEAIEVLSAEERLARARQMVGVDGVRAQVLVPLVVGAEGSHARLLSMLTERYGRGALEVDGRGWDGRPLDPDRPHDIAIRARTFGGADTDTDPRAHSDAEGGTTPRTRPGAKADTDPRAGSDAEGGAGGRSRPATAAGSSFFDAASLRAALAEADALGAPAVAVRVDGRQRYLARAPICPSCGRRVADLQPTDFRGDRPETAGYRLGGLRLAELLALSVTDVRDAIGGLTLPAGAARAVTEVTRRLAALDSVGLDYLALDRESPTLSRGEAQRLRLAVLLTNRVEDVIHVLDEPTIGLDPDQVGRVLAAVARLPGPVLMVEHDRGAVADADEVVELGPGAGRDGGRVVFQGTPAALWRAETPSGRGFSAPPAGRAGTTGRVAGSIAGGTVGSAAASQEGGHGRIRPGHPTGQTGAKTVGRAAASTATIGIRTASLRNLRGVDCDFPIGQISVVTGPSGAGKTTLVRDVLVASLAAGSAVGCAAVTGPPARPLLIDQSPIGRNARSNPATYSGLATRIRDLFARASGLAPATFSFNRPEGACEACEGMGAIEFAHRYLPTVWLTCESCGGRRFRAETLDVRIPLNGDRRSIAEVFALPIGEATAVLGADHKAVRILATLSALGLDYLTLGQPSPSLSGGEAQRLKLAGHLARTGPGDLLALDEPTTGLHPADLDRLLAVLDETAARGATVVVVEHHPDVVAAADHVVRLGPEGGPRGGELLYAGPPQARGTRRPRPRATPRRAPRASPAIRIRRAAAHNLRDVSLDIDKSAITALVGMSGSGKSSLLVDVVQAEATRRLLESLSMYERQSVREGPQAPVAALDGLGPTVFIGAGGRVPSRATVGTQSEVGFHLAVLLAHLGERDCERCGAAQQRRLTPAGTVWSCPACGSATDPLAPRHFLPTSYEAACLTCAGLGTVPELQVERLIVKPDRPLCAGAMYSPGFFPGSYLGKPGNGGYDMLQALAARHGFDPFRTPWREMGARARDAFLYGDPEPLEVLFRTKVRETVRTVTWRGFTGLIGGWDVGGLYTDHVRCADCAGERLRPPYRRVRLGGHNRAGLHTMPLVELARVLAGPLPRPPLAAVAHSLRSARARLGFLGRVGLGYVSLDRGCASLSAGEAQRLKLAALLGGELTNVTVLLDEPSRGLHPSEVGALADELVELRRQGNTLLVVEHDGELIRHADTVVLIGPGAGRSGGEVVARGSPATLARGGHAWALGGGDIGDRRRRTPTGEMVIRRPRENNLSGADVAIPLGVLVGICGVSGSGKSTLAVDTLGRALDPPKVTTSVAYHPVAPGRHDRIDGAPPRTVVVDQATQGVTSPGALLGVSAALRRAFAAADPALAAGLTEQALAPRCDACHGRGQVSEDMGFLPDIRRGCDACAGTGYTAEVRELAVRGRTLPDTEGLTLDEVGELWHDVDAVVRPLGLAGELGLGYLVLRQPAASLSGGELQRLKLARELGKAVRQPTLFVLDEPTVGHSSQDVTRLVAVLDRLVDAGHSVLVVDHHPGLLAACDRLLELGPGAGPDGGRVVARGTPEEVARGRTATAPYLREVLGS